MTNINQLPVLQTPSDGDLLPVYVGTQGSTYKLSLTNLLGYLTDSFVSPGFTVQTASASSGDSIAVTDTLANVWLIVRPSGALSTLTIRLPGAGSAFDGQEVLVSIDNAVATLSIGANGCDFAGKPFSCDSTGLGVRFRFQSSLATWWCLTQHGDQFENVRINDAIRDGSNNEVIVINGAASAVNQFAASNAATGGTVTFAAAGDDTNVDAAFKSKGSGTATLESPGGDVNVRAVSGNAIVDVGSLHTFAVRVNSSQVVGIDDVLADFSTPVKPAVYTVANLPSAATVGQGARAFVTDSNATLAAGLGNTVAAGGANKVPVYSDGTDWKIGG